MRRTIDARPIRKRSPRPGTQFGYGPDEVVATNDRGRAECRVLVGHRGIEAAHKDWGEIYIDHPP